LSLHFAAKSRKTFFFWKRKEAKKALEWDLQSIEFFDLKNKK